MRRGTGGDVGRVSEVFLYCGGNDFDRVVLQGRSIMTILGAGLCLLIFFCSNRLFRLFGGLISELLAVFDPNLLAHSALVTSDVTAAFFFTAAAWSYSRLLRFLNAGWFVITALLVWPVSRQDVGCCVSACRRHFGGCAACFA
ncbi:MAG: hypothetical protein DME45_05340 [Verrucomicrobia bacterium]|nr:MAG: hypothetical protein DME45_05340 [Verrucomicrobiota bacterium]